MFHCNSSVVTTARLDTATTLLERSAAPGILTAKTLQSVLLSARHRNRNDEVKPSEEIVSPYGRMQRQDRVRRYKNRPNDLDHVHTYLRPSRDIVARRKRCRKLDPMPALMSRSHTPTDKPISNQISGGNSELEVPDKVHIEQLRSGLNQNKSKQQQDAERLQREIQWIHGHFPVLKLANAKCSRSLRQQLFRTAIIHVLTNFTLRKALLTWYQKLLDAQRKERLQLSASRQLIAMFGKLSLERAADRFNAWRQWVFDSQAQENMAAAITLQRFSKFLRSRREGREAAEQQASLLQAFDKVHRSAKTIQRTYLKYRQHLHHCRDEFAARQIQRIAKRRRDYIDFIKRRNAAAILQRSYRAHLNRRSRKRARTIAQLLDHSREQQARHIQTAWCDYKEWRDNALVEVVHKLVDQVEFLDAVLAIQRHLRRFQCRFRIKKKADSAIRIQKCWQDGRRREASRAERRMVLMQQNLAASCVQRTFRRHKVDRKVRGVLRKSTRPLYLRARHFSESFREQFRLPIDKSAIVVIQTTWRRHFAYEKEKRRRIAASKTIRGYLKHGVVTSKWRTTAMNHRHRRDAAARTLQHWIRRLRSRSSHRRPSVVNILKQISATTKIQLWYRRRRCDLWRFLLDRLLVQELPRCIEAVNRIAQCWKSYCARKQENLVRASALADLIERQRQSESENCAARTIQRMIKRRVDKRKGQILLHQYRILLRQDMKRRQQRVIVHKYLEEKSQLRKKKQESQAATLAARQPISINSMESSQAQVVSLDSYISEASAFSLDENPNNNDVLTAYSPVQYWSDEYQRAYLYDPVTGVSTWL